MAALPPTWAERASSTTPESSMPPAAPARDLASPSPTPSSSKASTSDNWRAGSSSRVAAASDGWTAVKEERKPRPSVMSSGSRENGGTRSAHHTSSSKSGSKANKSTPTATAATGSSWATADPRDDSLPSPTFAAVRETSAVSSDFSLAGPAPQPQTSTGDSPAPVKAPSPAPLPTVNPWTVRKAQLAASAASVAPLAPLAQVSSLSTKDDRTPKDSSNVTSKASKRSNTAKVVAPTSSSTPRVTTPPVASLPASTLPAAQQDPIVALKVEALVDVPVQRKSEGWTAIKEVPTSGTVAGGDLDSWPAPNEEVAGVKAKVVKGRTSEQVVDELNPKKKADKTKWIQIKTDIRVAGTPSTRAPSGTGEKRAKSARRDGAAADSTRPANGVSSNGDAKKAQLSTPAGSSAPATSQFDKRTAPTSRPAATPKVAGKINPLASRPDFPLPQRPATLPPLPKPSQSSSLTKSVVAPTSNDLAATSVLPTTTILILPNGIVAPLIPNGNGISNPMDNSMHYNGVNSSFRGTLIRGARGGPIRGRGVPRKPFTGRPNLNSGGMMPFHEHDSTALSATSFPYSPDASFYPNQSPAFNSNQPYRALDPYTLDPTRYWLLGQLEWYMSVSNLVRDLYLRTKMDEQGWIDIAVIASFNRIKALTTDETLVRDTMSLTPILEVYGQFVRLRQNWPEWVLPNAIPSRVDANDAAAATPAIDGMTRDVVEGSVGTSLVGAEEGNTSRGMSSEDEGEGTAATTASTGSQDEASLHKVPVELTATPVA